MLMPIRRTRKAGNERGPTRLAQEQPAGNQPPRNLIPAEDLAFLAAWRSGLVPWPSAVLRVRQLWRANPELATAQRDASFPDQIHPAADQHRDECCAREQRQCRYAPFGRRR